MNNSKILDTLEESKQLPELPKSTKEIFKLLRNQNELEIEDLCEKVSQNKGLDNLLLICVNSGYFKLNKQITSVNEAVVYLGLRTVQNLLISFITQLLFPKKLGRAELLNREKYWRHSLGTSIASSILAEKINLCKKIELFSYGLIHDIGIAVLDVCIPEVIDEVIKLQKNGMYQIAAERHVMDGLTHSDVGSWLCKKWDLPDDIRNVIEYHHKPLLARNNINEVKLIHLGDIISTDYYEKLLGIKQNHIFSQTVLSSVGATKEDMHEISVILPEEVEKAYSHHIFSI